MPHSSQPPCNLSDILGIWPSYDHQCAGIARTTGARCRLTTNQHNRSIANDLLQEGSNRLNAGEESITDILTDLAPRTLCVRWHQSQASGLVSQWSRKVDKFVQQRRAVAARESRESSSSRQSTPENDVRDRASSPGGSHSMHIYFQQYNNFFVNIQTPPPTPPRTNSTQRSTIVTESSVTASNNETWRLGRASSNPPQRSTTATQSSATDSNNQIWSFGRGPASTISTASTTEHQRTSRNQSSRTITTPPQLNTQHAFLLLPSRTSSSDNAEHLSSGTADQSSGAITTATESNAQNTSIIPAPRTGSDNPEHPSSATTDTANGTNNQRRNLPLPRRANNNSVRRRPIEGDCGICYLPLVDNEDDDTDDDTDPSRGSVLRNTSAASRQTREPLVWCKNQCGHNYHKNCMDPWVKQCGENSRPATCPTCRALWRC